MSVYDILQTESDEERGQVKGAAIGIVTNNQDSEGLGRVKVRYPWMEGSQESFWARMAVPMAGNDRGTYFLPEVGDEVLLAFDRGDVRHPFMIGGLWNGRDSPPETNDDGENNVRKIRSRSGHEVILNDKASSEQVEIKTQGGHQVLLDDSSGQEKIVIKDRSGSNLITIDSAQNSMTIESGLKLTIKSTKIDIEASAAMKIKAGGTLTLQGALVKIN